VGGGGEGEAREQREQAREEEEREQAREEEEREQAEEEREMERLKKEEGEEKSERSRNRCRLQLLARGLRVSPSSTSAAAPWWRLGRRSRAGARSPMTPAGFLVGRLLGRTLRVGLLGRLLGAFRDPIIGVEPGGAR